ncbi:MAG: hypothetical protein V7695_11400 [Sulfitobacter sp.]
MGDDLKRSEAEPTDELPAALSRGRTVEAWCDALHQTHGVRVAARTMKKRARATGCFMMCGKQMLLLPEHVDALLNE